MPQSFQMFDLSKFSFLSALAAVSVLSGLPTDSLASGNRNDLGLVVKDGQFYRDGEPYKGVGINYFSCFIRIIGMGGNGAKLDNRDYVEGFRVLKEHRIPFVRFCAGGFWPKDWDLYLNDKEKYFELLDQLVAEAEKQGIGLIPSLFWTYNAVPDLVGETLDQWGNRESKTHDFMKQYTTEVVSRYKGSPAIWAWEMGNEWIHEADIPQPELGRGWIVPAFGTPTARSDRDKMFRPAIYEAQRAFYETIRGIDPSRAVITGDAMPRPAAWHNRHRGSWSADTPEQWKEVFLQDNSFDTLSVHIYHYQQTDRPRDSGILSYGLSEQIAYMMEISREVEKPLFIGEFGQAVSADLTLEEQTEQVKEILQIIAETGVPLAALWNYDLEAPNHRHFNITATNERAGFLKLLGEANQSLSLRCSPLSKASMVAGIPVITSAHSYPRAYTEPQGDTE